MAETLVENRTCGKCGVVVRKGALFCYNCGDTVAPEIPVAENNTPPTVELFREERIEDAAEPVKPEPIKAEPVKTETLRVDRIEPLVEIRPEMAPTEEIRLEKSSDEPIKKPDSIEKRPDLIEEAKLKSAASLRRKAKPGLQKRKVEQIVWTGHENAPNAWFIVVALVLTLFATGVFWLAMNLK